jgi:hypothetical protein
MIDIEVKTDGDARSLADLIASTQGEEIADASVAQVATFVRERQAAAELDRPPWQLADTVDFRKLDDDNDWTDV